MFPFNFLDFGSDTIEKQGIINLSIYYISVVFSDSEVIFLDKERLQPFIYFSSESCL